MQAMTAMQNKNREKAGEFHQEISVEALMSKLESQGKKVKILTEEEEAEQLAKQQEKEALV